MIMQITQNSVLRPHRVESVGSAATGCNASVVFSKLSVSCHATEERHFAQ